MRSRHVGAIFFFLGIFGYINGYYDGKRAADRWYAKHQPVATTQQIVTCSGVTLIDPITVRTTAPVASVEEPR